MYYYKLYNLIVKSKYKFDEYDMIENDIKNHHIIVDGTEEFNLDHNFIRYDDHYNPLIINETSDCIYVLNKGLWRICVRKDGKKILLDEKYTTDFKLAISVITHLGINMCLHFRGFIPFHSAAFSYKNRIFSIIGDSGAGKSTLTYNSLRFGTKFISDDVLPITVIDDKIYGTPSNSIYAKIDMNSADLKVDNINKIDNINSIQPLQGMFLLVPMNDNEITNNRCKIYKESNINIIMEHLYANVIDLYIFSINYQKNMYKKIKNLSFLVDLYIVKYCKNINDLNYIINEILNIGR